MKYTMKMPYDMEELVPVVRTLTEKYTGKQSTSVTYEMAERLMGAVLFCINEYWQEAATKAVDTNELLKKDEKLPPKEAYEKGYQAVVRKVLRAKAVYEELITDFRWYGNLALYDTVLKGMPAFFTQYDARFFPQDHILTLDYPILRKLEKLCGVDRIYEYLQCIRLEQRILSGFSGDKAEKILKRHHAGYKELFLNLPSVLINTVIEEMTDSEAADSEATDSKKQFALELLIKEHYDGSQEILEYLR